MDDVLAANAAFYAAFSRRDAAAMDDVWARESPVACLHPGWEPLVGRDAVMQSWRGILLGGGAPAIRCEDARAFRTGPDAAFVVCIEHVPGGLLIATNVFVNEHGTWRLAHHHSSPLAQRPAPPSPLRN